MLKDEYPRLFDQDSDYQERARAFAAKVKDIHAFIVEQGGYEPSQAVQVDGHLRRIVPPAQRPAGHRSSAPLARRYAWPQLRASCAAITAAAAPVPITWFIPRLQTSFSPSRCKASLRPGRS